MKVAIVSTYTFALITGLAAAGCSNDAEDCHQRWRCGFGGGGGEGGSGAGGSMDGGGGTGGQPECMDHPDCTNAGNAQCDMGSCVPCTMDAHCDGVPGLSVCDAGTCVECLLGKENACMGNTTCDVLNKTCTGPMAGTVDTCEPCSNDVQCLGTRKCIPLDYPTGTLHGYYCLEPPAPPCPRPYILVANKMSISGEPAATYCGVAEDLATCEAVRALLAGWFCTQDGRCSDTMGGTEVDVLGALCRDLFDGNDPNRCTYRCSMDVDEECPAGGSGRFCGDEMDTNPPDFCGGDMM